MVGYRESFLQLSFEGADPNADVLQLLMYSNFREQLSESTQELHDLTDRIVFHQVSRSQTSLETYDMVLPLMAMLIESRERAKRIYRDALSSRMSTRELDIDPLCDEMHEQLVRTNGLLRLYPRRDSLG